MASEESSIGSQHHRAAFVSGFIQHLAADFESIEQPAVLEELSEAQASAAKGWSKESDLELDRLIAEAESLVSSVSTEGFVGSDESNPIADDQTYGAT